MRRRSDKLLLLLRVHLVVKRVGCERHPSELDSRRRTVLAERARYVPNQAAGVGEPVSRVLVRARDAAHDLHPFRPVALVHRAKLVAAATHSVGANSL